MHPPQPAATRSEPGNASPSRGTGFAGPQAGRPPRGAGSYTQ